MKNKCLSLLFCLWLLGLLVCILALPDQAVSASERRTLRQFPVPSAETVFSGTWATKLDAYLSDQFPARETFRRTAFRFRADALGLRDYKGVYGVEGSLVQTLYPLNEDAVLSLSERIDGLSATLFQGSARYCSLIPDKGTFYGEKSGHLALDFSQMEALLAENCQSVSYVPIADLLSGEDYYKTDIHWRQERILPVAERLSAAMGASFAGEGSYTAQGLYPFYGSYASRTADPEPETLTYLTSGLTEGAAVDNLQKPDVRTVYDPEAFFGMDGYDVFLSGASPLITVTNAAPDESSRGRTLVLFRDSFGSSIAPLLLGGYERIVLVDLRYMSDRALPEYLALEDPGQTDVLFLYCGETANTRGILR